MKFIALFTAVVSVFILSSFYVKKSKSAALASFKSKPLDGVKIGAEEKTKMSAAVFKAQDYCRIEMKDFEFDVQFKVVSATVYFTGTNFKNVEKGTINSISLKPIKEQMNRCAPGSVVIFDDVKILGPDSIARTINGLTLLLY